MVAFGLGVSVLAAGPALIRLYSDRGRLCAQTAKKEKEKSARTRRPDPRLGELTRRSRKPPAGLLPTEAARDALAVLITDYRIAAQAAISRPEARQPRSAQRSATSARAQPLVVRRKRGVALTITVASDSADPL
jgi:hypothetical protein